MTQPECTPDGEILLEIFPNEQWRRVFDSIEDPKDLNNCAKTSHHFHKLLESQKPVYLIPQVLQLMDSRKYLNYKLSSGILKCRLVCSRWKFAIDRLLETRPYHSKLKSSNYYSILPMHMTDPMDIASGTYFPLYNFSTEKLETEIIPKVTSSFCKQNCPFPSRHLQIYERKLWRRRRLGEPIDFSRYRDLTETFLKAIGHHIWHVEFDLLEWPLLKWYDWLIKYVKLLPNLKSLYLLPAPGCTRYDFASDAEIMAQNRILFPTLKHLQLVSSLRVPGPVLNEILLANDPKIVDIFRAISDDFQVSCIQNPKKLALAWLTDDDFNQLSTSFRPQVLYLNLKFTSEEGLCWSDIFTKLECCRDSLEELSLEFKEVRSDKAKLAILECSRKSLDLPKLTLLDVKLENSCSLDFLLGLESLQYLFLRSKNITAIQPTEGNAQSDKIDFSYCSGDSFMECNIWKLIPSLKQVCIRIGDNPEGRYSRNNIEVSKTRFLQNYILVDPPMPSYIANSGN